MLALLPLLLVPAVQQDIYVQTVSETTSPGQLTQHIQYGDAFSTGWELDEDGRRRAMLYSHPFGSGSITKQAIGAFMPGGESEGLAVNVSGQAVGWAEDIVGGAIVRRPFLFDEANGLQPIDLPQAAEGWATGIAIFGHSVAGTMRRADGSLQAWSLDLFPTLTTAVALPTPDGWESEALDMRQSNGLAPLRIAGLVRDPAGREFAAFWDGHGGPLTILETPGTGDARLTGMGHGTACGYTLDTAGHEQAFMLDLDDPVDSLVTLPTLGGAWTRPAGIDFTSVYGASEDALGRSRAFQFLIDGQVMEDVNDRANVSPGTALTDMTSSAFGSIASFDLEVDGVTYGAFSRTVVSSVWPKESGVPTTLSMFSGPDQSLVAFVIGVTEGTTPVPGIPGLVIDMVEPVILSVGVTDSTGNFAHTLQVPASAAGLMVLVQAVVPTHAITTSVEAVTFQ